MKKRFAAFIMLMILCCMFSLPAYAVAADNNGDENTVVTQYTTSDGVLVKVYGYKHIAITEQNGFLLLDGEITTSLEDGRMTRGSEIPPRLHMLSDGSFSQSGTISKDGYTFSDRLFYAAPEHDYKLEFSGSASSSGGDRNELYFFQISVYDDQYALAEIVYYQSKVSFTGKISWNFSGSTWDSIKTRICYCKYETTAPSSTSYDITVS